jgi:hypothetical protein
MNIYLTLNQPMPNLFFIFKKIPENNLESFVSWCAGPMVHCDIVPGDHRIMFTSYMFERFSMNKPEGYTLQTHECLSLQVSQEEHDNAQTLLLKFVERGIPYNYSDVFRLIMPSGSSPDDIFHEEQVQSLFCSQAITLVLKMTLKQEHSAYQSVQNLNSRVTTPTILYNALCPFCCTAETFFDI